MILKKKIVPAGLEGLYNIDLLLDTYTFGQYVNKEGCIELVKMVKKLQDAPLGSVIPYLGTTDPTDGKWLVCDGRDTAGTAIELETHYPSLYMFLGGTNVLPDLREVTLVGVGENTTDSIANHDVYTLGQFKDDQLQDHAHQQWTCDYSASSKTGDYIAISNKPSSKTAKDWNVLEGRVGTTTHGKQKGVNYIIKAVSSVDYYHAPASEIAQIEQYFDNGINTIKNNGLSYSTEEVWTGGYWIDGKKIYRRTVSCGALPNNTTKSVAHNIANISWIVKYNGMASDGNEWLQLPVSYYSNSAIGLSVDGTNIVLRPYSNRTTYTTTLVTIEYIKTTE